MNNTISVSLKRIICFILIAVMISAFPVFYSDKVYAEDSSSIEPLVGCNNDYNHIYRRTNLINSYITSYGKGYMTVNFCSGDDFFTASYFDSDFKCTSRKEIKLRYPFFAGFYESDDYYFVVTGKKRDIDFYYGGKEEDDAVINVEKYSKKWEFLAECSVRDSHLYCPFITVSAKARTIEQPFKANLSMDMDGKYLVIRTAANIDDNYIDADGTITPESTNSVNIVVDTDTMKETYSSFYNSLPDYGNLLYPINQFVRMDDHSVVVAAVSLTDPKAFCAFDYNNNIISDNGELIGDVTWDKFMDLKDIPNTQCGAANIGGFEIGDNTFLIAGNAFNQDEKVLRNNIFTASVNKHDHSVRFNWITKFNSGYIPHLVKLKGDKFMILFQGGGLAVNYALVNQYGELISQFHSVEGDVSDCHPEVINGKIVWYTCDSKNETFYEINANDLSSKVYVNGEEQTKSNQENDSDTDYDPERGYDKRNIKIDFENVDEYYHMVELDWQNVATFSYYGIDNSEIKDKLIVKAEDPENCVINMSDRTITFKKSGRYTVTAYPKSDPNIKKEFLIIATKPLSGVSIECKEGEKVEAGSEVNLVSFPDGGHGKINYDFIITGPDNDTTINSYADYLLGCGVDWYPQEAGEYTIKVKAYGDGDYNKPVESSKITITVVNNKESSSKDPTSESEGKETIIDQSTTEEITNYTHTVTYYMYSFNTDIGKISNKTYTGKAIKPTPTVKYDGKKLKRGRDYTLSYKSNKNVGTAKVTITGKGNYSGTITKTFKIIPKKPTIKKPKAAKKAITVNWKAMKTKMSKKRITGYQVQIAKNKKFTKGKKSFKVKGYKETSYKFTKLKSKTKYYVRVRTYKTISGKTYYSKWSAVKNIKTK